MINKNKVIYLGPVDFPNGGAAARRILGNVLSIKSNGYDVSVVSGTKVSSAPFKYKGIEVYPVCERRIGNYPRLLEHLSYLNMGANTLRWLDGLEEKPAVVILYSGYSPYLLKLQRWCKKNNVVLIFDAVEWYEPSHQTLGLLSPYQMNIELSMRYLIGKCDGVICISSFLSKYYTKKNKLTVQVPPTVDTDLLMPSFGNNDSSSIVRLAYAGSPGKKDDLNTCLLGLLSIDSNDEYFSLDVAGMDLKELLKYSAFEKYGIKELPKNIRCHGKISYDETHNLVRNADFTVLLRKNTKSANAGFPTKVVESLCLGTPVIANHTSDLSNYIIHGETGIVCEDSSVESFICALNRVRLIDREALNAMRVKSSSVGKNSFDYRLYSKSFSNFIDDLIK